MSPPGNYSASPQSRQPPSGLSALGRAFLDHAPFRDIQRTLRFVTSNPKALNEPEFEKRFRAEAINAIANDDLPRAQNCVEKWVMITHCDTLSNAQTGKYFQNLRDRNEGLVEKFDYDYDRYWRTCVQAADLALRQSSRAGPAPRQDNANEVGALSRQLGQVNIGRLPTAPASRRHEPRETDDGLGGGYGLRSGAPGEDDDGLGGSYGFRSGAQQGPLELSSTVQPTRHETEQQVRGLPSEVSEPSFQGTGGGEERLDKRYYKRSPHDAGKLLKVGRVFAILRHSEFTGDDMGQLKWRSRTKQGVEVFSHICRMVVVKECHGFVWAIPVNTYSGHGVGKRGFNQDDIDAHAVIYMDDEDPRVLKGEPRMKKTPIKVTPVGKETLEAASRINFSKPHSIDHNVKFLNIGKVAASSMPYLTTYWKQYL